MSQLPSLSLIAALDTHGAIGRNGALPWHLPNDLRRFKALTIGKPILMGRKTFDSIGRALPQRRNLVLSRLPRDVPPGVELYRDLSAALRTCDGEAEVMVIGGGQIYRQCLDLAQRLYLTHVDTTIADADAFFPAFAADQWQPEITTTQASDGTHAYAMRFIDYQRIAGP